MSTAKAEQFNIERTTRSVVGGRVMSGRCEGPVRVASTGGCAALLQVHPDDLLSSGVLKVVLRYYRWKEAGKALKVEVDGQISRSGHTMQHQRKRCCGRLWVSLGELTSPSVSDP